MRIGRLRIIYVVVMAAGLLWIINTRPIWLDPMRALEVPPKGVAADQLDRQEQERTDEMQRRILITAGAGAVAFVITELLIQLGRRL